MEVEIFELSNQAQISRFIYLQPRVISAEKGSNDACALSSNLQLVKRCHEQTAFACLQARYYVGGG
jgi:hypothetical protein